MSLILYVLCNVCNAHVQNNNKSKTKKGPRYMCKYLYECKTSTDNNKNSTLGEIVLYPLLTKLFFQHGVSYVIVTTAHTVEVVMK